MALVYPADINSWTGKDIPAGREEELISAIAFAQAWIARTTGILSLEKTAANVTFYIDGDTALGGDLWMPPSVRAMWHSGSDLAVITEDGATLTSALGYSESADVIIIGAHEYKRPILNRPGGWSRSLKQNVSVACKVGFAPAGSAVLPVPEDVRRLIAELAWLLFQSSSLVGKSTISEIGTSVSITNDLSPAASSTLDLLRVL